MTVKTALLAIAAAAALIGAAIIGVPSTCDERAAAHRLPSRSGSMRRRLTARHAIAPDNRAILSHISRLAT